jgi:cell division protein FtsQ
LAHVGVSGAHVTPSAEIVRRAALAPRGNIWLQNLGAASARIEALPYVRTAVLRRIPPNSIAIGIVERSAVGCLVGQDGVEALVDADGRILVAGCDGGKLPRFRLATLSIPEPGSFVHDDGLARLEADARALSGDGQVYVSFAHDRFGDVDATLPNGVVVQFGAEGDLQEKARLVQPILREVAGRGGSIATIDLRAPRTPVVRYRTPSPASTGK